MENFYPLLIFVVIGLVRLLISNKKKRQEKPPPLEKNGNIIPPPPIKLTERAPSEQSSKMHTGFSSQDCKNRELGVKRDPHFWKKKKKARVQTLVAEVGSKRKLFLLSEILRPYDDQS